PGQTQPSTAAYWQLFARGFTPTGAWSNATKYQPDALVTLAGQTYRANLTNTNKQPTNTTYWELFAAKGLTGPTGAQGPQGETGVQGAHGAAGPNTDIAAGSQSVPAISFTSDADHRHLFASSREDRDGGKRSAVPAQHRQCKYGARQRRAVRQYKWQL